MYIEVKTDYGTELLVNPKHFYLEKRESTYWIISIYSGKEYDVHRNTYAALKKRFKKMGSEVLEIEEGEDAEDES